MTSAIDSELGGNRTGKDTRHSIAASLRQSIYGRLAGYEDTNNAGRLCIDTAMRQVAGDGAKERNATSTSLMGRFETGTLTQPRNLELLIDLAGTWVDRHSRYVVFQMAEVAVSQRLFWEILDRIERLRAGPERVADDEITLLC